MTKRTMDLAAAVTGVLAASLWLGGLLALGAIVAPIVFRIVPAPSSGDAMTVVFHRFDQIALGCAAIVALAEVFRARAGGVARADALRIVSAVIASGCALVIATSISPRIAELHAAGAMRGVGPLGAELDRIHDWATRLGKVEAFAVAALIALHVVSRTAGKSRSEQSD
jgi:uncharacterized membrane protein